MITVHLKKLRQRTEISPDEEQAIRAAVGEVRDIRADELVIRSGEELSSSVLLLDGWLARSKDLAGGERQVTELHVAGDFADLHGFTLKRLDHDVMALSDCRVALVPHERIREITEEFPRLGRVFWFSTNVDAAITRELALSLGQRTAISRMAHLFCELYVRLDVVGKAKRGGYEFPLTQRELSECLGLTVVHANRTLQELRRRGLVELENRQLKILDRRGLEGVAEFDPAYLLPRQAPALSSRAADWAAQLRCSSVGPAVASTTKSDEQTSGFAANWRSWLLALLLIAGVVVAALHWADVKQFAALVAHAQPLWLLAAAAAQLLTYVALAVEWELVLRAGKCRAAFGKLLGLTVSKHFADQMVPTAGMSGNVVVVDRLQAIGASRAVAVAALIMTIVAYYASYGVASLIALVLLWLHGKTSWLVIGLISASLALSAAIPALALWLQRKGAEAIPRWLRRIRTVCELFEMIREAPTALVRNGRLIGKLTLLNGAIFALDGLTMQFCLFALGVRAPFSAAFSAFILASIVVTLGPVPMGLGSFEAVSIGMLRALGVPFEAALSATLLFRGYTLWLPLLPGMVAARRQLKRKKRASGRG